MFIGCHRSIMRRYENMRIMTRIYLLLLLAPPLLFAAPAVPLPRVERGQSDLRQHPRTRGRA